MTTDFYVTALELKYDGTKEFLDIGTQSFLVSKGEMGFTLLDIPDSVLLHVEQNLRYEKEKLNENFHVFSHPENYLQDLKCLLKRDDVLTQFLNNVNSEWATLSKTNSLWGLIVFLYPLMKTQMSYRIQYGYRTTYETQPTFVYNYKTEPLKAFAEEISFSFNQFKRHPLKTTKEFFVSPDDLRTYSEKKYNAVVYISESFNGKLLAIPTDMENQMVFLDAMNEFADCVLEQITEIRTIQEYLRTYFSQRADSYPASFSEYPDWLRISLSKTSKGNTPLSLTDIVAKEQNFYIQKKCYIKHCELCGGLFIASKVNSKYCDKPNSEYGWKTCKEASIKKCPEENNPLYKPYNSLRVKYRNWINSNLKRHPEYRNTCIEEELDQIYEKWNSRAQSALSDYKNRKITFDEAMIQLERPPIEDRSPMLYKAIHK